MAQKKKSKHAKVKTHKKVKKVREKKTTKKIKRSIRKESSRKTVLRRKELLKRQKAAKKGWVTRRANEQAKKEAALKRKIARAKKKAAPKPSVKKKVRKKKPRLKVVKPKVPIYHVKSGSADLFSEVGAPESADHFMNSSHASKKAMDQMTIGGVDRLVDVFEKAFQGALSKGPFEADEVHIYRHGIIIRPRQAGEITDSVQEKLQEMLKDVPNAVIHIVDEHGTSSIRIGLGSATKGENIASVTDNLQQYTQKLQDIYAYIQSEYDDTDWFAFWDTEESMYE